MDKGKRVFTALVTAFHEDETVNMDATRKQMRRQIEAGNNLFCCGTNGDFSSLSFEEKIEIVKAAVDEVKRNPKEGVKVYANAGCPSTFETLRLARKMTECGVDALAVVAPYFISCNQESLYWHYSFLSEKIDCPLYIYDIPSGTHNPVEPETVKKLSRLPNIKGIKDTSGSIEHLQFYCALKEERPDFEVYVGPDHLIYKGFSMGADGCVSGMANVFPRWINDISRFFNAEQHKDAEDAQERIIGFRKKLYSLGFPPALVKRALYMKYPEVGNNRMPVYLPDEKIDKEIHTLLKEYTE